MNDIITTTKMATKIAPVASYALKNAMRVATQASFMALALVIGGFATAGTAEAAVTNYVLDLTGQGCGNNCADFQNYLAANGVTISSGTGVNGNSNSNVQPSSSQSGSNQYASNRSISPYPYQIYTNFPSTDAYYRAMSATSTYNMPQTYPYQIYTYFQNPGPKYDPNDPYMNGTYGAYGSYSTQYPMQYYVYNNGTSAAQQLAKYPVAGSSYNYGSYPTYGANYGTGYGSYPVGNGGFVMTSGR